MNINAGLVKELREKTGAGMMDCKKALMESDGDIEKATDWLRKKGITKAEKRSGRVTNEGVVEAYIHPGSKLGVLLELDCETDFVARTDDFKELAKNLSMQIAAADPKYIKRDNVPLEVIAKEKEIYTAQLKETGKPDNIIEKIVLGKLEKYYTENCLMEQPYIRDNNISVEKLITAAIAKIGENISVKRFARFKIGE
jgi:elongation factor Ts